MIRYEENFKQMIVELHQTGRSVRGLAKEYGLSEPTILFFQLLDDFLAGLRYIEFCFTVLLRHN